MKRSLWRRVGLQVSVLAGGGCLIASSGLTCAGFASDVLLSSIDMCFLFDCNNGAIGGLIDFCADVDVTDPATDGDLGNFFTDCPDN